MQEQAPRSQHDAVARRATVLRREIFQTADQTGTHPSFVIQTIRTGQAETPAKRLEVEERYSRHYAYVGDIHGLKEPEFVKLRESLMAGSYDAVFVIGDIGGSEKLARLQRLFYQGSDSLTDNLLVNRYKQLKAENADDDKFLAECQQGYKNIYAFQKGLESGNHMTEEEARRLADELTPEQILAGIHKIGKYVHYGHYVSNLPDAAIISLAADVEEYYDRFATMAAELQLHTKAKVFALRGNWDARLPFDFEPGTDQPIPLSPKARRFNDIEYFKKKGVAYFSNLGTVETQDAIHIMVPFDSVAAKGSNGESRVGDDRITLFRERVEKARAAGKSIIMVAHAVPAQEMHYKPTTKESEAAERNLRRLIAALKPEEIVYGHEHAIVKKDGNSLLNHKYRLGVDEEGNVSTDTEYETTENLSVKQNGTTLASYVPIPGEPFSGIAETYIPDKYLHLKNAGRRLRAFGGLRAPVQVGSRPLEVRRIDQTLPTNEILSIEDLKTAPSEPVPNGK